MFRFIPLLLVTLLFGCASLEKESLQPYPADQPLPNYQQLLSRAKTQISAAHELFYADRLLDLQNSCANISETGELLTKLARETVPTRQRDSIAKLSADWKEGADALKTAAAAKDSVKINDAFSKLSTVLRALRAE